jgi:hypothetical protein
MCHAFHSSLAVDRSCGDGNLSGLPKYEVILQKFTDFKASLLDIEKRSGLSQDLFWSLQDAVILGCQILIPPLRGKPFWALREEDSTATSIFLTFNFCLCPNLFRHLQDIGRKDSINHQET